MRTPGMSLFLVGLLSGPALAGAASSGAQAPGPRLTSEEAVVRALNTLRSVEGGVRLEHPRHRVGSTRGGALRAAAGTGVALASGGGEGG